MSEEMNVANVNEVEATGAVSEGQDLTFKCAKCGEEFVITAGEVEWYQSKGFELPKICKHCRDERKAEKKAAYKAKKQQKVDHSQKDSHSKAKKEFEPAEEVETKMTCSECGKEFTLSAEEIKWFNEKKFFLPHKCPECRTAKKKQQKNDHKQKANSGCLTTVGEAINKALEKEGISMDDFVQDKETA